MSTYIRSLELVAKEINVRTQKIQDLTEEIRGLKAKRESQQADHKISRDQNIKEAHQRIVYDKELGPEMTWERWVKSNLTI